MSELENVTPPDATMPKDGIQVRQDITLKELATTFHQSGFFKDVKSASQAVVKVMAGHELGISPIAAMRGIHVFEGKVELSGPMMAALIKRSTKYRFKVIESTDKRCEIEFVERDIIDPSSTWESCGPNIVFDRQDAENAELAKFDGNGKNISTKQNWRKYLADMLMWRCLSRGFRRYCSELAGGDLYVSGEISEAAPLRMAPQPPPSADTLVEAEVEVVDPTTPPAQAQPTSPDQSEETQHGSDNEPDPTEGNTPDSSPPVSDAPTSKPEETSTTPSGSGPESKPLTRDTMLAEMKQLEETVFQANSEMRDGARVEYLSKSQPAHCPKKEIAAYHEFLVRMAAQAAEQTELAV